MPVASGRSSPARALSTIELTGPLTAGRLLFLIGLGVLTVVLHKTFHYPLKMPGHHGLEAMALLVLGRLSCASPVSASIVGGSTVATSILSGADHDPATALFALAPAVVLDLAVYFFPAWRSYLIIAPIAVAIGHALKPVMRMGLFETFGMHFGSLRHGLMYPLTSHLVYGFAGGLIAMLLWRAAERRRAEFGRR